MIDSLLWAVLPFPDFDPIAVRLGPIAVRWYALSYIVGLVGAWQYCRWLTERSPSGLTKTDMDDFLLWCTLGVVLGGRLGYVLFYQPAYFLAHPEEIPFLWQGGMSFHGGMLGVTAAAVLFCRRKRISFLWLTDFCSCTVPIGLFLGRLANFVNGELYGRASDVSWAMVFPTDREQLPRHPSQLYEAALEGLVLLLVMYLLVRAGALRLRGALSGAFLLGYGIARWIAEYFREPDAHLGLLAGIVSMGQLLSLPMILGGLALIAWARRRHVA